MAENDKKKRSGTETARRIWLAGIGAYGRAFTEAQEALKDVTGETSRVFDELVQKGEMIEKVVEMKGRQMADKVDKAVPSMPSLGMPQLNMDERISKMRSRLMRGEDVADDIGRIEARLDQLEAKLDKVLAAVAPKKSTPKKSTTRKTSTKKT